MSHRSGAPAPAHKRRGARCLSSTSRCDGKRRRDGGCLVGIVAPDLSSSRHQGVRTNGEDWGRGRPRESTSQLGGRDEALPREAPEARVRSALPHASNRACPVVASEG